MSMEYYIFPALFWVGSAVVGVGIIVALAMVVRAVWDLIKLECSDD